MKNQEQLGNQEQFENNENENLATIKEEFDNPVDDVEFVVTEAPLEVEVSGGPTETSEAAFEAVTTESPGLFDGISEGIGSFFGGSDSEPEEPTVPEVPEAPIMDLPIIENQEDLNDIEESSCKQLFKYITFKAYDPIRRQKLFKILHQGFFVFILFLNFLKIIHSILI